MTMSEQVTYLTREGLKKLEEELEHLRTVRRAEIADRLHQAMEDGELIENAEYEAAKNEQAFIEGRILTIEVLLSEAVLIEEDGPTNMVRVGSTVKVQEDGSKPEQYTIVGAAEANPAKGLISNESPLGKALLGRKVGDEIKVNAPAGVLSFKVIKIE
ncbi:MAG TPA: transcription elongation factor GreA [Anaerolineales bacterium]|nr:transcription elongation factor GreA [Anaerolineales bacterium]